MTAIINMIKISFNIMTLKYLFLDNTINIKLT